MKCKSAQEQIHSLVGGELPAWEAWRVKRHCALCPACQTRREQVERLQAGLREIASVPTPERVRAAIFAQLPAIATQQNATYHMQVSLGLDARAKRRYAFRRLVRVGCLTAAIGTTGLLIAPHVIPDFPDAGDLLIGGMRDVRDLLHFGNGQWEEEQSIRRTQAEMEASISPKLTPLNLAQAKRMREHWKPWAIQQKPSLRQMLKGGKQGFAALLRIYQDLPVGLPQKGDGLTFEDLNVTGLSFTWQPAAKISMTARYNSTSPRYKGTRLSIPEQPSSAAPMPVAIALPVGSDYVAPEQTKPGTNAVGNRANSMDTRAVFEARILKEIKTKYISCQDIEISRSHLTRSPVNGMTFFSLCASGRITETRLKTRLVGGRWMPEPPKTYEIYPPYEELTR